MTDIFMKKSFVLATVFFFISLLLFSCNDFESLNSDSEESSSRALCVAEINSENSTFSGTIENKHAKFVLIQARLAEEELYSAIEEVETKSTSSTVCEWSCNLSFPEILGSETQNLVYFKFSALDESRKFIEGSETFISLFVDASDSSASPYLYQLSQIWKIIRTSSETEYSLLSKSELESKTLDSSDALDAFQNDSFNISSDSGILSSLLQKYGLSAKIFDENGDELCDCPYSVSEDQNPVFTVDEKLLFCANENLSSEKHLLKIVFYYFPLQDDLNSDYEAEENEANSAWFIWYPESDEPRIQVPSVVSASADLEITISDDDSLEESYFALLSEEEAASLGDDEIKENPKLLLSKAKISQNINFSGSNVRQASVKLRTPGSEQQMTLLALVFDKVSGHNASFKKIKITIVDENTPVIQIDSPENNTAPVFCENAVVEIFGTTIDKLCCSYLEVAYIPNDLAENGIESAKKLLSSVKTKEEHENLLFNPAIDDESSIKIWGVPLSVPVKDSSSQYLKQNFSLKIDYLSDFSYESADDLKSSKQFLFKLTREDSNFSYLEYKLLEDTELPEISLLSPSATGDELIVQPSSDLLLSFYAKKSNCLSMDTASYAIYRILGEEETLITDDISGYSEVGLNPENSCFETTISKKLLSKMLVNGESMVYRLVAKDLLGNENSKILNFSLLGQPILKTVSVSQDSTLKTGDEIIFEAEFSSDVKIQKDTYLKFYLLSSDLGLKITKKAKYISGSESDSLKFSYIVQNGDIADSISLDKSALFLSDDGSEDVFLEDVILSHFSLNQSSDFSCDFALDGISPEIESLELLSPSDKNFVVSGDTLSLSVTFSEKIFIASDDNEKNIPSFTLFVKEDEKSSDFSCLSIPLKDICGKNSKTLIFSKKITELSDGRLSGFLFYDSENCIQNFSLISDEAGNDFYQNSEKTDDSLEFTLLTDKKIDISSPKIVSMTPDGETKAGSNIFKNGKKIELVFDEAVQKGSGKIKLRQTKGWAIPPVLTEGEYEAISRKIGFFSMDTFVLQDKNGSPIVDSEAIFKEGTKKYPNDTYHGTGRYSGPYRKSVQSLVFSEETGSYIPDLTEKYVLDFDIDIWETDEKHYFGKTFSGSDEEDYKARGFESQNSKMKVDLLSEKNAVLRTANQIRSQLESAHYHERIIELSDSENLIEIDEENPAKVTLYFPAGLTGKFPLEDGREWELILEDGTFLDMFGNPFDQNLDSENNENVIQNINKKMSFFSDKVAKPYVRLDRYSYGLGIYQSDKDGKKASQIAGDSGDLKGIWPDSVSPTGFVRLRIDCETRDAVIKYQKSLDSLKAQELSEEFDYKGVFAGGNGDYTRGGTILVFATGTKEGFEDSEKEIEGIFQTVVKFCAPKNDQGLYNANLGVGLTDLSIRGKRVNLSDGYDSGIIFPLKENLNGSPYLRRVYRENSKIKKSLDYYWISYEILEKTAISTYAWSTSKGYYDFIDSWTTLNPGETTEVSLEN